MQPLSDGIQDQADRLIGRSPETAMIAVFDYDGVYHFASASHLPILGYDPAELVGRRLAEFITPEDLEHANLAFMDAVIADISIEIGIQLVKRSGDKLPVRAQAWNIEDAGTGRKFMLGRSIPVSR